MAAKPEFALAAIWIDAPDGRTLSLHVGADRSDAIASAHRAGEAALKAGHDVTWEDGTREWIATEAVFENFEHVFHDDGDRILCLRKRISFKNGERCERILRRVWKNYDVFYREDDR